MTVTKLIEPNNAWLDEIQTFKDELICESARFQGCASLKEFDDVSIWLSSLTKSKNNNGLPLQLIYVDESTHTLIGMIELRELVTDYDFQYSGNIGYTIRKQFRNKGHGSNMLHLALPICKQHNLNEVLITCVTFNKASEHVILHNGGVYIDTRKLKDEDIYLKRYLIKQ